MSTESRLPSGDLEVTLFDHKAWEQNENPPLWRLAITDSTGALRHFILRSTKSKTTKVDPSSRTISDDAAQDDSAWAKEHFKCLLDTILCKALKVSPDSQLPNLSSYNIMEFQDGKISWAHSASLGKDHPMSDSATTERHAGMKRRYTEGVVEGHINEHNDETKRPRHGSTW